MTTLYLIRHGEYENSDYVFPGMLPEFPLSAKGRAQVQKTALFFSDKSISAVYSSPALRTKQTAQILGSSLHLPVILDARLREVKTGLDGISMTKFDDTNGELSYLPEYQAKGAESMEELASRMVGFIEEKRREHEGKATLVVTHGDPMRFVIMKYTGLPLTFEASRRIATPLGGGYRMDFDGKNEAKVYPIVTT